MDPKRQPGVQIGQIYVNELKFSHRPDSMNLPHTTPADLDRIKMEIRIAQRADQKVAILTLRASTDPEDAKSLYQFVIELTATATVVGEENLPPAEFLRTAGPATLYPFLRELLANVTMRGRFGPVWLKPFNFRAIDEGWRGSPPKVERRKSSRKGRQVRKG